MNHIIRRLPLCLAAFLLGPVLIAGASGQDAATTGETEVITVNWMMGEHPLSPVKPDAVLYQEIRKRFNIDFVVEAVLGSDFTQKKRVLLATGQMPDIVGRVTLAEVVEFGEDATFLPLLERINEAAPNIKERIEKFSEYQRMLINDELYLIPRTAISLDGSEGFRFPFGRQPMIRKDLVEKHGLKMPESIDELYSVLTEFKRLYPDKHIWTNRNGTKGLVNCTAYPLGSGGAGMYFDKDVDGGTWVYGDVMDEFRNYVMAFYRKLYAEGILDPDYAINTSDQFHEKMGSGKSLFFYDNMTMATNHNLSLRSREPDANLWPIAIMENQRGQSRNFFYIWFGSGYAISAKTEHPDRVLGLFDWLHGDEGILLGNWGIEGVHYSIENGVPAVLPEMLKKYGEASDPYRSMNSDLGTQELQFGGPVDTRFWHQWDTPDILESYQIVAIDPNMVPAVVAPPFTPEEQETLKKLNTEVGSLLLPAMDLVIIGEMTLEEFTEVQKKARAAGADEIARIYNAAEARL
jgi:putative aldouronate transport system substrate-binding protein